MFVVILNYIKPLSAVEACLAEHRQYLDRNYARGVFIASGPQQPRTGGVIFARNVSRPELEAILAEDPFQQAQVASYQVIEFEPNKFCEGAGEILA